MPTFAVLYFWFIFMLLSCALSKLSFCVLEKISVSSITSMMVSSDGNNKRLKKCVCVVGGGGGGGEWRTE